MKKNLVWVISLPAIVLAIGVASGAEAKSHGRVGPEAFDTSTQASVRTTAQAPVASCFVEPKSFHSQIR